MSGDLKAGRVLDALIAEKVFGFRRAGTWLAAYPRYYANPEFPEHHQECPRYSTDITAAWEVVEKCGPFLRLTRAIGIASSQEHRNDWMYEAGLNTRVNGELIRVYGYAETAPLAICKAAIRSTRIPPIPVAGTTQREGSE